MSSDFTDKVDELDDLVRRTSAEAVATLRRHLRLPRRLHAITDRPPAVPTSSAPPAPTRTTVAPAPPVAPTPVNGSPATGSPTTGPAVTGGSPTTGDPDPVEDAIRQDRVDDATRPIPVEDTTRPAPVTVDRLAAVLARLGIRCLAVDDGSLLALWDRHALQFAVEGADESVLVMRVRLHPTAPQEWSDRAHQVVNTWNRTHRFYKAYLGEATARGQLPIYGEIQLPVLAGMHEALLVELVDCAAAVAMIFVDWLHDEGALL